MGESCLLSPDEQARAARMVERIASRFVAGRSALRRLLGGYLNVDPAEVAFSIGAHGKPRLACTEPDQGLVFSVAHCDGYGLIGLARDCALGVDVELARAVRNLDALATRCLTESERLALDAAPASSRSHQFLAYWTAKEAFVKAVGRGLAIGLNRCSVHLGESPGYRAVPPEYGAPTEWRLNLPKLPKSAIGAVCTRHANASDMQCFEFDPR